jgi:hypothetical protein
MTKEQEVRKIFRRLYNLFRSKSGSEDRFEDHPGFDKCSGRNNQNPWDRIMQAAEQYKIDLQGYIFTALKKIMEDNGAKEVHPHFLLNETLLLEYQRTQPSVFRSVEIQWQDQLLIFDSETKKWEDDPGVTGRRSAKLMALLMSGTPYTSLFTFYQACLHGCAGLATKMKEEAQLEYSLFPHLFDGLIMNEDILEQLRRDDGQEQ